VNLNSYKTWHSSITALLDMTDCDLARAMLSAQAHRQHKVVENKPFWRSARLRFWTVKIAWCRDTGKNETSSTLYSVERSPLASSKSDRSIFQLNSRTGQVNPIYPSKPITQQSPPRIPGLTQRIRDPNSACSFSLSNSEFPESQRCKHIHGLPDRMTPMFPPFSRVMLKSLGLRFLPIGCVTVRLRLSLMPVVAMFDRPWRKRSYLLDRFPGMWI
jgi:hypothetical protein